MRRTHSARLVAVLALIASLTMTLAWVPVVAQGAPGSATISGRVTDKVTGSPLSGINVQVYYQFPNMSWNGAQNTNTDANGNYTLTAMTSFTWPMNCALIFTDPTRAGSLTDAHRNSWWPGVDAQPTSLKSWADQASTTAGHFTLNQSAALTGYDAQLKRYFPSISGKVVDKAGNGLSGVWIQPYVQHFASWIAPVVGTQAKTDSQGGFTVWVNPWLETGCFQTVLARDGMVGTTPYDGRWYPNLLQKPTLTQGLAQQAVLPAVKRFELKSGETTSGLVITMTRDVPDSVSITKVWRTTGRVAHVKGKLTPVHDPAIPVRVQYYKYSSSKHKYLKYGASLKATASSSGDVTKWSAQRKLKKGKFAVQAYVGKHLWTNHRAYKTGLKKFTVR